MIRASLAVIIGLMVWVVCATALDIPLRYALPGYAAAEPQLQFTLPMMIARLALPGAVPSVAAGFAGAWISRGNRRAVAALAIVLLAIFLPTHYYVWTKVPLWYHLVFLVSLPLLTWLGATLHARLVKN
ncbi:MAG: hypothetical protein WA642_07075 [Steroidobacteraceae bacterium]